MNFLKRFRSKFLVSAAIVMISACASESHRVVESATVSAASSEYQGEKQKIIVGKFSNRSDYLRGAFAGNVDKLGNQAKLIAKSHLQQSGRFTLFDRESSETLTQEAKLSGTSQKLVGAEYAVVGGVTEFGRKVTGDRQLFGILGSGKSQVAYAKVTMNVIRVETAEVVHSVQGAGEYQLSNREIIGFGGKAAYDSTLNGKVLNLAITEAVNVLVSDLDNGRLVLN
ncbi:CsgG/HfaB family protein [Pseudoteredinibacter isoporae]|uniref:Curli production assembly/transport component CsgG n=1 Tax=Pseudoteredinibacter isoporae TaxID=570281 RepID=A0A7X0JQC7_9GAMM|nr:CsgG/HfaB family protein [Pseudoteredinibacter isoporae]MBB6520362.1 curli biogenesis system outer membrane secretion channel CsgG [Pseudoteredinibacter isoporae]NHO85932.1 curli production assembly protein CsgG [Pseudoteredinibacter isoporae]NIB25616.1 curli production assembly protein CsgG [Pseudoteredinibacter isoporae]